MKYFIANIDKIKDNLNRSLIWFNIAAQNKMSLWRIDDYITFLEDKLLT